MPSFVTFSDSSGLYKDYKVFDVWNYNTIPEIFVKRGENGIFIIDSPEDANIHEFLEFVSGIFHPDSNFSLYICHAFSVPIDSFRGVKFDFNNVEITATKDDCDPKKMFDKWYAEQKNLLQKNKKRWW